MKQPIDNGSTTPNLNEIQAIIKNGGLSSDDVLIMQAALDEIQTAMTNSDNHRDFKNLMTKQTAKYIAKYNTGDLNDYLINEHQMIVSAWDGDDVRTQDDENELTDDQVENVLSNLIQRHDANDGINWEVINCYVQDELR